MPPDDNAPIDLLDLKLLPAWVKEGPDENAYADFEGETADHQRRDFGGSGRGRPGGNRDRRSPARSGPKRSGPPARTGPENRSPGPRRDDNRRGPQSRERPRTGRPAEERRPAPERPPLKISIRFLPNSAALESVAAQIKADALAYSVFSLARLFLQKPERYLVHLAATPEQPLYQLGESGPVSADRAFLENNAFRMVQNDFYKPETAQTDPIKGNFTSIARDRVTGTVLGPTNYHDYQRKLRGLFEQRFSRRMSFPEFQRQIEIVSNPELVEQWKEEARTLTTFTTLGDDPAAAATTFSTAAEAEKHFRQQHLPNLVRTVEQVEVDGVASRNLTDRVLRRAVEMAWTAQTRSPSQIMAELSNRFRETGLHVFRHRKGMLFVSPIRQRPFGHEETTVSPQVRAIVETISANPRINRKDLADKVLADAPPEEAEARKLSLASYLKWLIGEGHVIEFNDGSLDLPRAKTKPAEPGTATASPQTKVDKTGGATAAAAENPPEPAKAVVAGLDEPRVDANEGISAAADSNFPPQEEAEIGGS